MSKRVKYEFSDIMVDETRNGKKIKKEDYLCIFVGLFLWEGKRGGGGGGGVVRRRDQVASY